MKTCFYVCTFIIMSVKSFAFVPDVLFILPEQPTMLCSEIYNMYKEFHRGNIDYITYDQELSLKKEQNTWYVRLTDENLGISDYRALTISATFNTRSIKQYSGANYSTAFSQISMNKIFILGKVFYLLREIDPEYFNEFKSLFKDLAEED